MTPAEEKRKRTVGLVKVGIAVVGILVAGSIVSRRIFEPPPRALPVARMKSAGPLIARAAADMAFRVASATGTVEVLRDGSWVTITPGQTLNVLDVVRTATGAGAVLRRGETEFELRGSVEARLDRLTADAASFDVLKGKVAGGVGALGQTLEIRARATRAVNDGVARFVVRLADEGRVDVASTVGKTKFSAAGKEVILDQGTTSHAEPGAAPASPEKIPEEVLLAVVWPGERRDERAAKIAGKVRPQSLVKINGVVATVAPSGQFVATVPLRDGANRVEVEAEELSGLTKRVTNVLERHTKAPRLKPVPTKLWPE